MIIVLSLVIFILIILLLFVLRQYNILWESIHMLSKEIERLRKVMQ